MQQSRQVPEAEPTPERPAPTSGGWSQVGGNAAAQERLAGTTGGDDGGEAAGGGWYMAVEDATLFALDEAGARPTGAVVREGDVLHGAVPADGGGAEREAGGDRLRYVATTGSAFGWIDEDAITEVDGDDYGVGDGTLAAGDAATGPTTLSAEDQANLVELPYGATLEPDGGGDPVELPPMASVVRIDDETRRDEAGNTWVHVRAPDGTTGWVRAGYARDYAAIDGGIGGAVDASGVWVAGFTYGGSAVSALEPGATERPATVSTTWGALYGAATPVEVLHVGGAPVEVASGGEVLWYVRSQAGTLDTAVSLAADTFTELPARLAVGDEAGWVRASLVRAGEEQQATSSVVDELATLFPNGFNVAFVTRYLQDDNQFGTFLGEAANWAQANQAVAVQGGTLVTGTVNLITSKHEILGVLNAIQAALRDEDGTLPDWARVRHLAVFAHGSTSQGTWGGLETDAAGWEAEGNLRETDLAGLAASLGAFATADLDVSLYACSTGRVAGESGTWEEPDEAEVSGDGSFADQLQDALAAAGLADATVMGHTTAGPTVRNPFARLFTADGDGAGEEGGDAGGAVAFAWAMDPLSDWLGDELARGAEATGLSEEALAADLRSRLFGWFRELLMDADNDLLAATPGNDPEAFRLAIRLRAREQVRAWLETWGVGRGGSPARVSLGYAVYPRRWDEEREVMVPVAPTVGPEGLRIPTSGATTKFVDDAHGTYSRVEAEGWSGEGPIWLPSEWVEILPDDRTLPDAGSGGPA